MAPMVAPDGTRLHGAAWHFPGTFRRYSAEFTPFCRPSGTLRDRLLVPKVGLEPTSPCGRWILSPVRLPIPPLGQPDSYSG